jgi:hypothetical protein
MALAVQDAELQDPNLAGFTAWVYTFMGVPQTALPPDSPFLAMAYDESINIAYVGLKLVKNRSPYRGPISPRPPTPTPTPPIVAPPHPAHPIAPTPPPPVYWKTLSVYSVAVYNLGGHFLVNIALDLPGPPPTEPPTFWSDLRKTLGLNSFSLGIINSASDQGTSAAQTLPDYVQNMSMFNMWLASTPWGRMYAMLAGQWGTVWGIS